MSGDPLRLLWDALEAHGCEPRGPEHELRARCPAHDGDNASALSVAIGADGRALVHCHAYGCEADAIAAALGLQVADLFPDGHHRLESAPQLDKPENHKPASMSEKSVQKADRTATGQTPALALDPDILGRFRSDLRRAGVAGEERLASLIYLA